MSRFWPAKQIIPGLWIGSAADAVNVRAAERRGIKLVVNCSKDIKQPPGWPTPVTRIPIDDAEDETEVILRHWPRVVKAIDAVLSKGGAVLVHCYAGLQRSAATVAAYLMWKYAYTAREAMRRVKLSKREAFTPKATFRQALELWQDILTSSPRPTRTPARLVASPSKKITAHKKSA